MEAKIREQSSNTKNQLNSPKNINGELLKAKKYYFNKFKYIPL